MARTSKIISLSVPPDVAELFEKMAKSKRQGKSGLFREMLTAYQRAGWLEQYRRLQVYGARKSRDVKAFSEADIDRLQLALPNYQRSAMDASGGEKAMADAGAKADNIRALLIARLNEPPDLGILGEWRINVLKLNLALDSLERMNE